MNELQIISNKIRHTICEVSQQTGTPHLGSSLSCVDILTVLYWNVLNIDPKNATLSDRDYFLLSKGHASSALYTALAYKGFYDISELYEHGKTNSAFEEHAGKNAPPGVEVVSGSLGHSLSIAAGMALAANIKGEDNRFYVLMGDGELNEGTIWEAAMFAAGKELNNLVAIVDFNKLQGTGESCEIMHLEPLHEKWEAFGWQTYRVDGHDHNALQQAMEAARSANKPVCIIADTVKGKGVSFMENDNNWHYRIPTADEVDTAAEELGIR